VPQERHRARDRLEPLAQGSQSTDNEGLQRRHGLGPRLTARSTIATTGGHGADSLILAKECRSARALATTPLCLKMFRRLGDPGVQADHMAYRQKWKIEAVMLVVKRRCGEALTARLDKMQRAQALPRGVAYNVQLLVRLGAAA
jgi:hypothetical protein